MTVTLQLRTRKLAIRPWSIILLIFCLVGTYFMLPQVGELRKSLGLLAHANPWLIGISLALVGADILLSAYAQLAAASGTGDFRQILTRELAGSFLNHFLPYSVGIVTLIEEYYRKITHNRAYAYLVATLPVLANFIISIGVLVIISPITITSIGAQLGRRFPVWITPTASLVAVCILIAAIAYRQKILSIVHGTIRTIRSSDPKVVTATLGLVLVQIIINAATLWIVAKSLGITMPIIDAFILILASNFTGNAAPTPGGLAVAEVTLVVGMTSIGLSLPDAVAITLLFRLITFWLELIPGGWALVRLRHI